MAKKNNNMISGFELSDNNVKFIVSPSEDEDANAIMNLVSQRFSFSKGDSVDSFIKKNNDGTYEMKMWDFFGNSWFNTSKKFGRIVDKNNNTDITIRFSKTLNGWSATMHTRRYYRLKDTKEELF